MNYFYISVLNKMMTNTPVMSTVVALDTRMSLKRQQKFWIWSWSSDSGSGDPASSPGSFSGFLVPSANIHSLWQMFFVCLLVLLKSLILIKCLRTNSLLRILSWRKAPRCFCLHTGPGWLFSSSPCRQTDERRRDGGTEGQRTALRYVLTALRRAPLASRTRSICVIFTSVSLRVEDQDRQMVHGDGDSAV